MEFQPQFFYLHLPSSYLEAPEHCAFFRFAAVAAVAVAAAVAAAVVAVASVVAVAVAPAVAVVLECLAQQIYRLHF